MSVFTEGCSGLLHEMDARDTIPLNGLPLCGSQALRGDPCSWSENAIISNSKVYIGQPDLNRIIVFHTQQLNVVHVIGTDPRPNHLWLVRGEVEDRIWILNSGTGKNYYYYYFTIILIFDFLFGFYLDDLIGGKIINSNGENSEPENFGWDSISRDQQRHNRKTVQIIRITQSGRNHNVIHLQPIDGHFDLVYNLFIPQPSTVEIHNSHGNSR